jgi:sulfatase maturation enzyme AslB (radical SAM superfamily)
MKSYPWMNQKEVELIEKYHNKDKIMLEWGSGEPTLYFIKKIEIYHSFESRFGKKDSFFINKCNSILNNE